MATTEASFASGRFVVQHRLHPCSSAFVGLDRETKRRVLVKLEASDDPFPNLHFEHKLTALLQDCPGVPRLVWFGPSQGCTVFVRELLGPSLQDLFGYCGRVLSLKTVLMLGDQIISRVKLCHSRDYLHRNIAPRHFLIGTGFTAHQVHIIGFERCKRYRHRDTHKHIPYSEGKKLVCDPRFASLAVLAGAEASRRDDLEAVGYMLLYLLRGKLPWDGALTKEAIKAARTSTSIETLCQSVPSELQTLLQYCRSLKFEAKPDYSYLKRLLHDCFVREHYSSDFIYDWNVYYYVSSRQNKTRKQRVERDEEIG